MSENIPVDKDRLAIAANQKTAQKEYWLKKLAGDFRKSRFPYDNQLKVTT